MPIRSDRGRNATLRVLATWPLHSPQRLVGTIAVLIGLCIAVAIVASNGTNRSAAPVAPSLTPTWSLSPTTSTSAHGTSQQSVALIPGDPVAAARRFADAWVSKLDPPAWRELVGPLCTDEFQAVILPALAPGQATAITGATTLVRVNGRVAEVTVPLDTAVLALTLQDVTGNGDWRISDAQPGR